MLSLTRTVSARSADFCLRIGLTVCIPTRIRTGEADLRSPENFIRRYYKASSLRERDNRFRGVIKSPKLRLPSVFLIPCAAKSTAAENGHGRFLLTRIAMAIERDVSEFSDISKMRTEGDGSFKRKPSTFRNWVEKGGRFEPERGEY